MTVYPPAPLLWQNNLALDFTHSQIAYVGYEGTIFHLSGPFAPVLGAQSGAVLESIAHLDAPFKHLDNKGARQDGTTWFDSLYDPGEIDMTVRLGGTSAADMRSTIRAWLGAWDPRKVGQLCWFSPDRGEWFANVRMNKHIPDVFKKDWYQAKEITFTWSARNDDAFWKGPDSVCQFNTSSPTYTDGTGYITLTNIGDQPCWPRYLIYGPGTFLISDINTGNVITFGPLLDGQIVLLNTMPRLAPVVDVTPTPTAAQQSLFNSIASGPAGLIKTLINFVTNNNVPPLLQQFESLFGITAPQGPLTSYLNGRFTNPLDPMLEQTGPVTTYIPCWIQGGTSDSAIIAAATPLRRWPE